MKKLIVIWANCQSDVINYFINKYLNNDYEVEIYINYEYLRGKMELPDIFSKCDYFLFQNYKKKNDEDAKYDLDYIKQNILKKDCITLCFPTLHANKLIFCYDCESPENEKTITKENPGGDFFFGISIIREYYNKYKHINDKNEVINLIIESFKNHELNEEEILKYKEYSITFLKLKILESDIPELYDFILNNYTKFRLWHNPNHPTGILYLELAKNIFKKLDINIKYDENDLINLDNLHRDWQMPLLNCVKKYYDLDFEDICVSRTNSSINNTETYLREYLKLFID